MTEPLTDDDFLLVEREHGRVRTIAGKPFCDECGDIFPCLTSRVVAEARRQREALDKVRELHAPMDVGLSERYCLRCRNIDGGFIAYPCMTAQALGEA